MVLAGPGSGKTSVIVERTAYMINEGKIPASSILVVTFSRAAATEMKERFLKFVGQNRSEVTFGTFHGIFYGILKAAYHLSAANILSEEEKFSILREMTEKYGQEMAQEGDFIEEVAREISVVKGNCISPEHYYASCCSDEIFRDIFHGYKQALKAKRKLDFDDMILCCYELFSQRQDILNAWRRKFVYILVDEFQDINRVQYDVIRMLALPENNLFVVGDDDQAIYGFRGADSEFMFRFSEDYPQAKRIILNINYRSSGNIVKNSMKVIGHNEKRFLKEFQSVKENGFCVHVQEVKDPNEEAQYVADEIEKRAELGISYEEMAVLFRIHTDARPVAEEFLERKIPFQMKERLPNLYDHFIAKDICAYFRLALGNIERNDLLQVMNRPKRYIGRDSVASGKPSFEEMRKFYCDKEWMLDRIDQFEWDVKMLRKTAPYAGINYIRKRIGYDDFLKDYAFTRKIDRANLNEVLAELEEAARPFATIEEWFRHIEEYTRLLRLKSMKRQEDREGVRLMTLHSAKGLEFDTVFLVEANEGKMPYKKAKTDAETEEERRLFYVGMTRAKEVLKVSYVKTKNGKETSPSRFVDELLE